MVSVVTALVVAVAALTDDAARYWAMSSALLVAAVVGVWRAALLGVWVDADELFCREWGGSKRIPLATITDVQLERYDGAFNSGLRSRRWQMIIVHHGDDRTTPLYATFQPRRKAEAALREIRHAINAARGAPADS